MRYRFIILTLVITSLGFSQESEKDSTVVFKKRVLESTEVDFLLSYYKQDGVHSSVSGGLGSEKLTDLASNIVIAMPLDDDSVLTVDAGISAYTSASSSNINPFDSKNPNPWQSSSGASEQDALASLVVNYSHSSDDRNFYGMPTFRFLMNMIILHSDLVAALLSYLMIKILKFLLK